MNLYMGIVIYSIICYNTVCSILLYYFINFKEDIIMNENSEKIIQTDNVNKKLRPNPKSG